MSRSRRSSRPSDRDNTSEPFPTSSVTPGTVPNSQDGSYFQASSTTTTTQIGGNGAPTTTTTSRGPPGSGTPGITITSDNPNDIPFTRTQVTVPSQSTRVRQRPIGIRRLPSANRLSAGESELGRSGSGRSRSSSAPLEPHLNPNSGADRGSKRLTRGNTRQSDLPTVTEGVAQSQRASGVSDQGGEYLGVPADGGLQVQTTSGVVRRRSVSDAARSIVSKFSDKGDNEYDPHAYEADIVDYLDVIGTAVHRSSVLAGLIVLQIPKYQRSPLSQTFRTRSSCLILVDGSTEDRHTHSARHRHILKSRPLLGWNECQLCSPRQLQGYRILMKSTSRPTMHPQDRRRCSEHGPSRGDQPQSEVIAYPRS